MNRIEKAFHQTERKSFVPYIMAGDGGLDTLKDRLLFLEKSGATAVELGIPFSDPVADGPTIQQAGIRALKAGTTLRKTLKAISECRNEVSIPLIVMTYINPVLSFGIDAFAEAAAAAGIDGCIIPDLPIEEEHLISGALEGKAIELIRLVTITSPPERIKAIVSRGNGYIYAVTVAGITGTRSGFNPDLGAFLQKVKELSPIPVLAGFGISTPDHVRDVSKYCDGVIVGSRIIDLFEQNELDEIKKLISASIAIQA
ncbi:tryptophan synthase subunit alpha [Mesobacillus harenae]|uniref:tryptophan synthase subunit alpha n=1 Tax=Mesobacillus harenae TaxID=2213203 RepID=UPI0015805E55|nr:tryptophan synthase subunit alpha [Mesobacillus harenae]